MTKPGSETQARGLERLRVARSCTAVLLCSALLVAQASPVFAADAEAEGAQPASSPSEQTRALAKAKYEQGVEAYRADRFADAVRSFLEADAISPSAVLSYNIARAYEKLSDDAQTLRWYRNYLRLDPNAKNAADVRGYVRRLSAALAAKGIQQVTVLSRPSGATVAIDGNPLGVTPLTVELPPGSHTALLSLRGYTDAPNSFVLASEAPVDLSFELQPAPVSNSRPTTTEQSGRRFGIVPIITLGVAGACLIGAGIFELSRRSAQNSAKNENVQIAFQNDLDDVNSRRTSARVLLGVGSVLAVTGGALLMFNTKATPETRVGVASQPGGALLRVERAF